MTEFPHLESAPITEALIDVRVRARPDLQASEFKRLRDTLNAQFPRMEERRGFQATLEFQQNAPPTSVMASDVQGYFFWSGTEKDVAQFRVDGFSLNRLKPYQSWEEWFPRFEDLWRLYLEIARPEGVTRIGVRCINHIVLPPGPVDLGRYLTVPPGVPPGLPLSPADFVMRLAMNGADTPPTAVSITQALRQGTAGAPQILLDIDAYRAGEFDPKQISPLFQPLHELRNLAFFSSITNHTVQLHQ